MRFHSPLFLFAFLPATLLAYHACGRWAPRGAIAVLLAASLLFYAAGDPRHLPLLLGSIAGNLVVGRAIHGASHPTRRRALLTIGVVANLAVLAAYKWGFGGGSDAPATAALVELQRMPLGLSFFTLQQISYLVDRARADGPEPPVSHYALYVAFFPHVVAGPILRFRDVGAQYARLARGGVDADELAAGLGLVVVGLGKKLLLADPVGRVLDPLYDRAAHGAIPPLLDAWTMGWGYVLQLYFDFSGYSDVAIGLALAFGLRLAVNFDSPLRALSPSDVFSRWHISLAAFVRDYVFSPLVRVVRRLPVGPAPRPQLLGWAVATMVSLMLVNLWHGSTPNFIASGLLIGATATAYQLVMLRRSRGVATGAGGTGGRIAGRATALLALIVFGQFFRADRLATVGALLVAMVDLRPLTVAGSRLADPWAGALVLVASAIALTMPNTGQIFELPGALPTTTRLRWRPSLRWSAALALLTVLVVGMLHRDARSTFIYVRF